MDRVGRAGGSGEGLCKGLRAGGAKVEEGCHFGRRGRVGLFEDVIDGRGVRLPWKKLAMWRLACDMAQQPILGRRADVGEFGSVPAGGTGFAMGRANGCWGFLERAGGREFSEANNVGMASGRWTG